MGIPYLLCGSLDCYVIEFLESLVRFEYIISLLMSVNLFPSLSRILGFSL
jgi:hypothetical protein